MSGKRIALVSIGIGAIALAIGLTTYFVLKKKDDAAGGGGGSDTPTPPAPTETCDQKILNKPFFLQVVGNGQQLSGGPEGNIAMTTNQLTWERWIIEPSAKVTGAVQIKNLEHDLYLQAYSDGGVDQKISVPDKYESFSVEAVSRDGDCYKVALKSQYGKYLGLNGDKTTLVNTATKISDNETFHLIDA